MNNQKVLTNISQAIRDVQYERLKTKLANLIVTHFRITDGQSLIIHFGHGTESNNFEAIRSWVGIALQDPELPLSENELTKILFRKVNKKLNTMEDDLCA